MTRQTLRVCALLGATLLLASCNMIAPKTASVDANGCKPPDSVTGLRLELVGQQMTSGQHHAALAHLDTLDPNLPQAQLMRARALRAIHDPVAAEIAYRELLNSCMAAYAHQGLGVVAADRRNISDALMQLQTARTLAPIDADIRNDYGFVLLAAGRIDDSLRELRTAVELDGGNNIATRNLMLALFIAQRGDEARALGQSHAFSDSEIETLATRARSFKPLAVATRPGSIARISAENTPTQTATTPRTNIIVRTARAAESPAPALVEIPVEATPTTVATSEPVTVDTSAATTAVAATAPTVVIPAVVVPTAAATSPAAEAPGADAQKAARTVQEITANETH